jgi:adenylate cyclase
MGLIQNIRLDMDLPIIDILCQGKAANQLPQTMDLSYREQWMEDIELYAPGYLALEAEGRAGGYSLHRLTRPDSIGTTKEQI